MNEFLSECTKLFRTIFLFFYFLMLSAIFIKLSTYLTLIGKYTLLSKSVASVQGFILLVVLTSIYLLLSYILIFIPSIMIGFSLDNLFSELKQRPKPTCFLVIALGVLSIILPVFLLAYICIGESQIQGGWIYLLLLAFFVFIISFLYKSKKTHKEFSSFCEPKSKLIYLISILIYLNVYGLFPLIVIAYLLNYQNNLYISLLVTTVILLVGHILGWIWVWREKQSNDKVEILKKVLKYVISSIGIMLVINILFFDITGAALRKVGVYSREEQAFLLNNPKKKEGVEFENFSFAKGKENIFYGYIWYSLADIRYICNKKLPENLSEKKNTEEFNTAGCIEFNENDIQVLGHVGSRDKK